MKATRENKLLHSFTKFNHHSFYQINEKKELAILHLLASIDYCILRIKLEILCKQCCTIAKDDIVDVVIMLMKWWPAGRAGQRRMKTAAAATRGSSSISLPLVSLVPVASPRIDLYAGSCCSSMAERGLKKKREKKKNYTQFSFHRVGVVLQWTSSWKEKENTLKLPVSHCGVLPE